MRSLRGEFGTSCEVQGRMRICLTFLLILICHVPMNLAHGETYKGCDSALGFLRSSLTEQIGNGHYKVKFWRFRQGLSVTFKKFENRASVVVCKQSNCENFPFSEVFFAAPEYRLSAGISVVVFELYVFEKGTSLSLLLEADPESVIIYDAIIKPVSARCSS